MKSGDTLKYNSSDLEEVHETMYPSKIPFRSSGGDQDEKSMVEELSTVFNINIKGWLGTGME